ncbi:DUF2198 domain-containing protein, partial [Staphylococcus pseudintermedius]
VSLLAGYIIVEELKIHHIEHDKEGGM